MKMVLTIFAIGIILFSGIAAAQSTPPVTAGSTGSYTLLSNYGDYGAYSCSQSCNNLATSKDYVKGECWSKVDTYSDRSCQLFCSQYLYATIYESGFTNDLQEANSKGGQANPYKNDYYCAVYGCTPTTEWKSGGSLCYGYNPCSERWRQTPQEGVWSGYGGYYYIENTGPPGHAVWQTKSCQKTDFGCHGENCIEAIKKAYPSYTTEQARAWCSKPEVQQQFNSLGACTDECNLATCGSIASYCSGSKCATCPLGKRNCDAFQTAMSFNREENFEALYTSSDTSCETDITRDTSNCGGCGIRCVEEVRGAFGNVIRTDYGTCEPTPTGSGRCKWNLDTSGTTSSTSRITKYGYVHASVFLDEGDTPTRFDKANVTILSGVGCVTGTGGQPYNKTVTGGDVNEIVPVFKVDEYTNFASYLQVCTSANYLVKIQTPSNYIVSGKACQPSVGSCTCDENSCTGQVKINGGMDVVFTLVRSGSSPAEKIVPVSTFVSPAESSLQPEAFTVSITDSDQSSGGLNKCYYQVASGGVVTTNGWVERTCDSGVPITVGSTGLCRDSCIVFAYAINKAGNSGQIIQRSFRASSSAATPEFAGDIVLVKKGWNLISVAYPTFTLGKDTCQFGAKNFYHFDSTKGTWDVITNVQDMRGGKGYWSYSDKNCELGFIGQGTITPLDIALKDGWNQIGSTSVATDFQAVKSSCTIQTILYYDTAASNWKILTESDKLEGYKAYFVKADC